MTDSVRPGALPLILVGAVVGLFSGLFGIGGGVVLVPALLLLFNLPQRLAAGTSVAAILPAAVVGWISYTVAGRVDWLAGALLAAGIIVGAQLGSRFLVRASTAMLQWLFMAFLVGVIVTLWVTVPQRGEEMQITLLAGIALVGLGAVTGILSGLLGVGGGVIVVPILMFFFGADDLVAKGTSLLMLIPGSLSGTLANARRGNVDRRIALFVGLSGCAFSPLGAYIAGLLEPQWANIAFSALVGVILVQLLVRRLRSKPSQ